MDNNEMFVTVCGILAVIFLIVAVVARFMYKDDTHADVFRGILADAFATLAFIFTALFALTYALVLAQS